MSAAATHLRLVTPDFLPAGLPVPPPALTSEVAAGRISPVSRKSARPQRKPLGQILIENGAVAPGDLLSAIAMRARQDVRLGDILLTHGWVNEQDLYAGLAQQWSTGLADLAAEPPDPRLIDRVGAATCLRHGAVPWRQAGGTTVIATARPEDFQRLCEQLPADLAPFTLALASERDLHAALLSRRQTQLARTAETRVPGAESCRGQDRARTGRIALAVGLALAAGLVLVPQALILAFFFWAVLSLVLNAGLKLAGFLALLFDQVRPSDRPAGARTAIVRLPMVSIMVPLYRERDIAGRLIRRLGRLNYPKELLDILLVVEEEDGVTRRALAGARLPHWMRVVTVPGGPIKTKPRALNYALDFCRGSIIGVYDAEDAPEPGQIHAVVRRFHERGPEVACLQGVLDFYNPRTNWLSRCFTIEYASWFRVMLPGLARLGLVVPLGGTTLFFRRAALESLGGWDAHNVTEDADLGLRLARHGYRTELIGTVTEEEANCHTLPWIRQRSRWLKGYAMTWAVHMRDPVLLWRQLGPKRFFGVQVLFLGTLSQYMLAPLLWSFWLVAFGLPHPVADLLPRGALLLLAGLFIAAELVNAAIALWAVRGARHRHLIAFIPTMHLYFPLGALASYKAVREILSRPFYWDKTTHGLHDQGEDLR